MKTTIFNNINPLVMERIKKLRLIDDELMKVVFSGDKEVTEFLIRILLNRNDLKVTKSMTQKQKDNLFGRSVKLDIVAEDIFKTEYNIEIQRADKGADARRIRYHQAMLDSHTLQKGAKFKDLPNLYIIFILEHDLFNRGNPIYCVKKFLDIKNEDDKYLPFDDGCNIMYVNGDYRGNDPLGKLMHDFSTPDADQMYYDELAKRVRFHKQNEKGVQTMCKIVEEYGDERAAEAFKQGAWQTAIENAIKMLKKEYPVNDIVEISGLSLEKILEMQKENN